MIMRFKYKLIDGISHEMKCMKEKKFVHALYSAEVELILLIHRHLVITQYIDLMIQAIYRDMLCSYLIIDTLMQKNKL
ncbi:unnamed protein product [Paramecium octaurelia]|uniref:Uncharacterized protein n=1 Tax=Paramecium octaurelia TaxID=43137 RepID=A0A8S1YJR7_PAROT|nr:unnamed protein product [Paramecium octaurelia]